MALEEGRRAEIRKDLPDKKQCVSEAQRLSRESVLGYPPYWSKYAGIAEGNLAMRTLFERT